MNYTMLRGDENMAKVEQCPGFETFGADVKTAREKLGISRRELAEKIGVDPRYLANIELNATIPSMPLWCSSFTCTDYRLKSISTQSCGSRKPSNTSV